MYYNHKYAYIISNKAAGKKYINTKQELSKNNFNAVRLIEFVTRSRRNHINASCVEAEPESKAILISKFST